MDGSIITRHNREENLINLLFIYVNEPSSKRLWTSTPAARQFVTIGNNVCMYIKLVSLTLTDVTKRVINISAVTILLINYQVSLDAVPTQSK